MSEELKISADVWLSVLLLASICSPGCGGGGGGSDDAGMDGDTPDASDARPEICISHPYTCHTGGGGIEAFDCCTPPRKCCNLCFPAEGCRSKTDCMETCPLTIPCDGAAGPTQLACYYFPEDFTGTVYCPVVAGINPGFPLACRGSCESSVVCPLPPDPYGDSALCCPEGWACDTVPGYDLPVCVSP